MTKQMVDDRIPICDDSICHVRIGSGTLCKPPQNDPLSGGIDFKKL